MAVALKPEHVAQLVFAVRGEKVMLDADLATLYGVSTKALNQALTRNKARFPEDFAFRLTQEELNRLRSQIVTTYEKRTTLRSRIVTSKKRRGDRRYLPYASQNKVSRYCRVCCAAPARSK